MVHTHTPHTVRKTHAESVTCGFFQRDMIRHLFTLGRERQRKDVTQGPCGRAEVLLGVTCRARVRGPPKSKETPAATSLKTPLSCPTRGEEVLLDAPTAGSCSLLPACGPSQSGEVPQSEEPLSSAWEGMVQRYQSEEIARQPQTPVQLRKPGLVALRKGWNLEAGGHRLAYQQVFRGW